MSVETVDIRTDTPEAKLLRARLGSAHPRLSAIAATPTRVVAMTAGYDADSFVMAGGLVGGPTLTCITGPACVLPEELGELLLALGEAASIPVSPRFTERRVPVPDALVLAEDVRAGAADDLAAALRIADLDLVPLWLNDLAHGVSATFLVLVTDQVSTRVGTHLVGLPSGWGHLHDRDGDLSMAPVAFDEIARELEAVGLGAASLVQDDR